MTQPTDPKSSTDPAEDVIIVGAAYDTPADNYEEFDEQLIPEKLGDSLIQTSIMHGSFRALQLYDSRFLLIKQRKKQKSPEKSGKCLHG